MASGLDGIHGVCDGGGNDGVNMLEQLEGRELRDGCKLRDREARERR